MTTYRTLREIKALDQSNHTLRWNRSLRDVGVSGIHVPPRRGVIMFMLRSLFTMFWAVVIWGVVALFLSPV